MKYTLILYTLIMLLLKIYNYKKFFSKSYQDERIKERDEANYVTEKFLGENKDKVMKSIIVLIILFTSLYYMISLLYIDNVYFTFISIILIVINLKSFKNTMDFIKESMMRIQPWTKEHEEAYQIILTQKLDKDGKLTPESKLLTKKQVSKLNSDRMKGNKNPMKNEETKEKVSKSLIEGYTSGRIKKVTGEKHWFWKGNRERNQVIRTRLYPVWVKPILIRDDFTCQFCFVKNRELEVHHKSKSFNDIVLGILSGRKIAELNNEEFENLIILVIKEHENIDGITCCVNCHKKIDPQRH